MITEKKIQVYSLLQDMIIKLLISIVMIAIMITIAVKLILDPSWPLAFGEVGTGGVLTIVVRHYFPRRDPGGE
jgi:hypothetical protein